MLWAKEWLHVPLAGQAGFVDPLEPNQTVRKRLRRQRRVIPNKASSR